MDRDDTKNEDGGDERDEIDETSIESFPASDPPAWTPMTGEHGTPPASVTPASPAPANSVENNVALRRFEVRAPEGLAILRYGYDRDGALILIHTEVPKVLEGRGIAGRLAREALEFARSRTLMVVAKCPFVAAYVKRHPEFNDLIRA